MPGYGRELLLRVAIETKIVSQSGLDQGKQRGVERFGILSPLPLQKSESNEVR